MKKTFWITQTDISAGIPYDTHHCPLSKAMKRNGFGGEALARYHYAALCRRDYDYPIRRWVHHFDTGQQVGPIKLCVEDNEIWRVL